MQSGNNVPKGTSLCILALMNHNRKKTPKKALGPSVCLQCPQTSEPSFGGIYTGTVSNPQATH